MEVAFSSLRRIVLFGVVALCLFFVPIRSVRAGTAPSPLRMPSLAIGSRCFGLLPCTAIDPFGIRLRAAVLAIFRPEKGRDRELYAARIQIAPSVTLFQWAEVGVAIPITLYTKDIGVTPIYEPLQPFARIHLPFEKFLGGLTSTAFVRIHISHGPFVGGLPPTQMDSTASPMPDLREQASRSYQAPNQLELGLAAQKRIGPVIAAAALGTSVAVQRVEVYGGAELGYSWRLLHAFVQGMGTGVPKCPAEEAALNFCARGFRFVAGVRFDFDIGQGGLLVGTGSGAGAPGWMVGAQLGLDYDETVRRMHGDGSEAAQAWWERRFEAMARGWAAWKSAAVAWHEDNGAAPRLRPQPPGPFSGLLPGGELPPSSPWLDGLLSQDTPPEGPLPSVPPTAGRSPTPGPHPPSSRAAPRPNPTRKPPSLFADANARAAAQRQLQRPPQFKLPGSLDLMTDEELAREQWRVMQEELRRNEHRKWQEASPLPPMEKAILNWVATAPARGVLGLLAMSGPGRRAEVEEQLRQLRPLKCTPAEEEACSAVEEMFDAMATMLAPSAAEAVVGERAMVAVLGRGAREAGQAVELTAAEQAIELAGEGAVAVEQNGPRFTSLLDRLPSRLNPMNYELCGVGCPGGEIRFRPPRVGKITRNTESVIEHDAPALVPADAEAVVDGGPPPPNLSPEGAARRGAFRMAKRQNGIPMSQQPESVVPNVDRRGNPQPGRQYKFQVRREGEEPGTVTIRDDAGGHDFGRGNRQNRGPHFNDPKNGHYDY